MSQLMKKRFPSITSIDVESDGNTSFLRAARNGQLDKVLEHLKSNIDINTSNANGLNALHLASKDGHVDIVEELLKRGAVVDAATKKGNTALHIASLAGQEEVVKLLVQHEASVNVQSQNGFTPLYMAAQENHDNVVRYLLASGANQSLSTEDGFTPLAVAMQQGHDKVVTVLLENDTRGKIRLPALHIAAKKDDVKAAKLLLENEHNPDVTSKSGFTPLHIASHYGNQQIANLLVQKGADVNYSAKHNITPLHVAAKWGKANMVALLLEHGATIEAKTRDGLTPLHCAARSGHEQVVDTLLEKGAPISSKTKNGLAPLHMAAQGDHVDAARILLYHRAPVDEVTVDYLTALHVAAHCGHARVAKLLLDRQADANARALNGFTPLHIACKKNRIKVVELLLKHGASIGATTESGLTPLHVASFMGCMNIVIYLLQHDANPDVPTVRGETPLHLAARANQTDIIRILLRNGAQVDARAREQQTPLHIASRLGNVDIVMLLLQHGAKVDNTTKDMYTALHIAAKEGQDEVAAVLLDNGASLDATTKKGFTPLHLAAKYGNLKVARLLLQKEAPVDAQGKNGVTPLHVASHYDHQNVALLLLDKGASPHAVAKNGHTPLHIAGRKNQMDIANTLLEYGAQPNAESKAGFTPLHLSAQEGHGEMSALLLEHKADANHEAKNGLTPLHLCAQEDRVPVAEVLVKNGAEVNAPTKGGYTPLHIASHYGQTNMVRFLLQSGADVESATSLKYTPLHQAAQQGHANIVNILLENKADPNAVTTTGQTPLNIAQKLGYITVIETLKVVTTVTTITTTTTTNIEEKYRVQAPELMHETFMSDSEEEGGEDTVLGDQAYRYLTADEMKSLGDDSLPIDVTRDERIDSNRMVSSGDSGMLPPQHIEDSLISPEHVTQNYTEYIKKYASDNVDISRHPINIGFLVSFLVDARGGAMRGCRHSGVRVIVPPRCAPSPTRITCRYVRPQRTPHPPPLMEGEALASRVLELGPVGAKFLGPVIIEVPHFAALRGKEREIVILRSDNGESWKEHTVDAAEEVMNEVLHDSFEAEDLSQMEDVASGRITRIVSQDFPQYFAVVSRVRQEVHAIGPEGGMVSSTVVPQVQAVFPEGALTKKIKVGLQAQPIDPELTAKLLGHSVAVSPVVTVEPRRRKFHKAITLSMPAPRAHSQGMINQYSGSAPTLRLLCSITGGTTRAQWEDVTGSTPLTFVNDCVSFTTTVSARFWLMDCRNISDATKMATELYKEAIHVPFMAKFVVFAKRVDPLEARLRVFCMTDDKEDKTLEHQEHFTEVAKSRDVEVLEGKLQYVEFAGNLVPVTKSGEQLSFSFRAFRENRLPFSVRVKDQHAEAVSRCLFMKESKVPKGEQPQQPICILNIVLPEDIVTDTISLTDIDKKSTLLSENFDYYRPDPRLADMSNLLGDHWVPLANQLGLTTSEINVIKSEYPDSVAKQAQSMLRMWLSQSGNKAKTNTLENALRRIGREDIIPQCLNVDQGGQTMTRIKHEEIGKYRLKKEKDVDSLDEDVVSEDVALRIMADRQEGKKKLESYDKYSAEEKVVEKSDEEEEEPFEKPVAERREKIEKRLSSDRSIPASSQRREIVQEITTIKQQSLVEDKIAEVQQKAKTTEETTKTTSTKTVVTEYDVQIAPTKTVSRTIEIKTTLPSDSKVPGTKEVSHKTADDVELLEGVTQSLGNGRIVSKLITEEDPKSPMLFKTPPPSPADFLMRGEKVSTVNEWEANKSTGLETESPALGKDAAQKGKTEDEIPFFQNLNDRKTIYNYTNALIQSESRAEPFNSHTERYYKVEEDKSQPIQVSQPVPPKEERKTKKGIFGTIKNFVGKSFESDSESEKSSPKKERKKDKKKKPSQAEQQLETPPRPPRKPKLQTPTEDRKYADIPYFESSPIELRKEEPTQIEHQQTYVSTITIPIADDTSFSNGVRDQAREIVADVISNGERAARDQLASPKHKKQQVVVLDEQITTTFSPIVMEEKDFTINVDLTTQRDKVSHERSLSPSDPDVQPIKPPRFVSHVYEDIEHPETKISDKAPSESREVEPVVQSEEKMTDSQKMRRKHGKLFGLFGKASRDSEELSDNSRREVIEKHDKETSKETASREDVDKMKEKSVSPKLKKNKSKEKEDRGFLRLKKKSKPEMKPAFSDVAIKGMIDSTAFLKEEIEKYHDAKMSDVPKEKKPTEEPIPKEAQYQKPLTVQQPLLISNEVIRDMNDSEIFLKDEITRYHDVRPVIGTTTPSSIEKTNETIKHTTEYPVVVGKETGISSVIYVQEPKISKLEYGNVSPNGTKSNEEHEEGGVFGLFDKKSSDERKIKHEHDQESPVLSDTAVEENESEMYSVTDAQKHEVPPMKNQEVSPKKTNVEKDVKSKGGLFGLFKKKDSEEREIKHEKDQKTPVLSEAIIIQMKESDTFLKDEVDRYHDVRPIMKPNAVVEEKSAMSSVGDAQKPIVSIIKNDKVSPKETKVKKDDKDKGGLFGIFKKKDSVEREIKHEKDQKTPVLNEAIIIQMKESDTFLKYEVDRYHDVRPIIKPSAVVEEESAMSLVTDAQKPIVSIMKIDKVSPKETKVEEDGKGKGGLSGEIKKKNSYEKEIKYEKVQRTSVLSDDVIKHIEESDSFLRDEVDRYHDVRPIIKVYSNEDKYISATEITGIPEAKESSVEVDKLMKERDEKDTSVILGILKKNSSEERGVKHVEFQTSVLSGDAEEYLIDRDKSPRRELDVQCDDQPTVEVYVISEREIEIPQIRSVDGGIGAPKKNGMETDVQKTAEIQKRKPVLRDSMVEQIEHMDAFLQGEIDRYHDVRPIMEPTALVEGASGISLVDTFQKPKVSSMRDEEVSPMKSKMEKDDKDKGGILNKFEQNDSKGSELKHDKDRKIPVFSDAIIEQMKESDTFLKDEVDRYHDVRPIIKPTVVVVEESAMSSVPDAQKPKIKLIKDEKDSPKKTKVKKDDKDKSGLFGIFKKKNSEEREIKHNKDQQNLVMSDAIMKQMKESDTFLKDEVDKYHDVRLTIRPTPVVERDSKMSSVTDAKKTRVTSSENEKVSPKKTKVERDDKDTGGLSGIFKQKDSVEREIKHERDQKTPVLSEAVMIQMKESDTFLKDEVDRYHDVRQIIKPTAVVEEESKISSVTDAQKTKGTPIKDEKVSPKKTKVEKDDKDTGGLFGIFKKKDSVEREIKHEKDQKTPVLSEAVMIQMKESDTFLKDEVDRYHDVRPIIKPTAVVEEGSDMSSVTDAQKPKVTSTKDERVSPKKPNMMKDDPGTVSNVSMDSSSRSMKESEVLTPRETIPSQFPKKFIKEESKEVKKHKDTKHKGGGLFSIFKRKKHEKIDSTDTEPTDQSAVLKANLVQPLSQETIQNIKDSSDFLEFEVNKYHDVRPIPDKFLDDEEIFEPIEMSPINLPQTVLKSMIETNKFIHKETDGLPEHLLEDIAASKTSTEEEETPKRTFTSTTTKEAIPQGQRTTKVTTEVITGTIKLGPEELADISKLEEQINSRLDQIRFETSTEESTSHEDHPQSPGHVVHEKIQREIVTERKILQTDKEILTTESTIVDPKSFDRLDSTKIEIEENVGVSTKDTKDNERSGENTVETLLEPIATSNKFLIDEVQNYHDVRPMGETTVVASPQLMEQKPVKEPKTKEKKSGLFGLFKKKGSEDREIKPDEEITGTSEKTESMKREVPEKKDGTFGRKSETGEKRGMFKIFSKKGGSEERVMSPMVKVHVDTVKLIEDAGSFLSEEVKRFEDVRPIVNKVSVTMQETEPGRDIETTNGHMSPVEKMIVSTQTKEENIRGAETDKVLTTPTKLTGMEAHQDIREHITITEEHFVKEGGYLDETYIVEEKRITHDHNPTAQHDTNIFLNTEPEKYEHHKQTSEEKKRQSSKGNDIQPQLSTQSLVDMLSSSDFLREEVANYHDVKTVVKDEKLEVKPKEKSVKLFGIFSKKKSQDKESELEQKKDKKKEKVSTKEVISKETSEKPESKDFSKGETDRYQEDKKLREQQKIESGSFFGMFSKKTKPQEKGQGINKESLTTLSESVLQDMRNSSDFLQTEIEVFHDVHPVPSKIPTVSVVSPQKIQGSDSIPELLEDPIYDIPRRSMITTVTSETIPMGERTTRVTTEVLTGTIKLAPEDLSDLTKLEEEINAKLVELRSEADLEHDIASQEYAGSIKKDLSDKYTEVHEEITNTYEQKILPESDRIIGTAKLDLSERPEVLPPDTEKKFKVTGSPFQIFGRKLVSEIPDAELRGKISAYRPTTESEDIKPDMSALKDVQETHSFLLCELENYQDGKPEIVTDLDEDSGKHSSSGLFGIFGKKEKSESPKITKKKMRKGKGDKSIEDPDKTGFLGKIGKKFVGISTNAKEGMNEITTNVEQDIGRLKTGTEKSFTEIETITKDKLNKTTTTVGEKTGELQQSVDEKYKSMEAKTDESIEIIKSKATKSEIDLSDAIEEQSKKIRESAMKHIDEAKEKIDSHTTRAENIARGFIVTTEEKYKNVEDFVKIEDKAVGDIEEKASGAILEGKETAEKALRTSTGFFSKIGEKISTKSDSIEKTDPKIKKDKRGKKTGGILSKMGDKMKKEEHISQSSVVDSKASASEKVEKIGRHSDEKPDSVATIPGIAKTESTNFVNDLLQKFDDKLENIKDDGRDIAKVGEVLSDNSMKEFEQRTEKIKKGVSEMSEKKYREAASATDASMEKKESFEQMIDEKFSETMKLTEELSKQTKQTSKKSFDGAQSFLIEEKKRIDSDIEQLEKDIEEKSEEARRVLDNEIIYAQKAIRIDKDDVSITMKETKQMLEDNAQKEYEKNKQKTNTTIENESTKAKGKGILKKAKDGVVVEIASTVQNVEDAAKRTVGEVEGMKESMKITTKDIDNSIESIDETSKDSRKVVEQAVKKSSKTIGEASGKSTQRIQESTAAVSEKSKGFFSKIGGKISGKHKDIRDTIQYDTEKSVELGKKSMKEKDDKIQGIKTNIQETVDDGNFFVLKRTQDATDDLKDAEKHISGSVNEEVRDVTEKTSKKGKSFLGKLGRKISGKEDELRSKSEGLEAKATDSSEESKGMMDSARSLIEKEKQAADNIMKGVEKGSEKVLELTEGANEILKQSKVKQKGDIDHVEQELQAGKKYIEVTGESIAHTSQHLKEETDKEMHDSLTRGEDYLLKLENQTVVASGRLQDGADRLAQRTMTTHDRLRQAGDFIESEISNLQAEAVRVEPGHTLKEKITKFEDSLGHQEMSANVIGSHYHGFEESGMTRAVSDYGSQIKEEAEERRISESNIDLSDLPTNIKEYAKRSTSYVTSPTMVRRTVSTKFSKGEGPRVVEITYDSSLGSSSDDSYIVTEPDDEVRRSKKRALFQMESEDDDSVNVTEEDDRRDSAKSNVLESLTEHRLENLLSDLGDSIKPKDISKTDTDKLKEHRKECQVEVELIEKKLRDLDKALDSLEQVDLDIQSESDAGIGKKLKRVERKFERMASEAMEKDSTEGKKVQLTSPEIEEKRETEYRTLVSQLSTEELSDFQKEYGHMWDEHTFSKSSDWDSKTPDSQADAQELPQGDEEGASSRAPRDSSTTTVRPEGEEGTDRDEPRYERSVTDQHQLSEEMKALLKELEKESKQ